jgi:hypothetical protein
MGESTQFQFYRKKLLSMADKTHAIIGRKKPPLSKITPNENWSLQSIREYEHDLMVVKSILQNSVDDLVIQATSRIKYPHEILAHMKITYADNTEIQKQNLLYEMSNLHYVDGAPIEDHITTFQILINKMINAGMIFNEQRQINYFLDTLPTSWRIEKRSYLSKISTLSEVLAQTKGTAMDLINLPVEMVCFCMSDAK